jgi:hypothetical protein
MSYKRFTRLGYSYILSRRDARAGRKVSQGSDLYTPVDGSITTAGRRLAKKQREPGEIVWKLHLSKQTIDSYRKNIGNKLNLHSTAELIAYAIRTCQ